MKNTTEIFKINGITVANIKNYSNIAFFGIAVRSGSNYETPKIAGISHFSEHMFFKGSTKRNWKQINEEFAKLGVSNNAYTSNTEVLYHTTCPKENLEKVIELMTDMFFNSTMPEEEIEKERNVIIEEKKMYDDDPKSYFNSQIGKKLFTWNVGHDTIGTFDTIKNISRKNIVGYLNEKINLDNFIFICCGDIDTKDLKKYIQKNIPKNHSYLKNGKINDIEKTLWSSMAQKSNKIKYVLEKESIEQSIIYMMFQGFPDNDIKVYQQIIICRALGGGMYSKLFSRIREELGLCYSVGMYNNYMLYPDLNIINLYGYTSPKNVGKFIEESEKILLNAKNNGIEKDIFECAKTDYLASILRNTETSEGRAMCLINKLLHYKQANLNEIINTIKSINLKSCNENIEELFSKEFVWTVMNPKTS